MGRAHAPPWAERLHGLRQRTLTTETTNSGGDRLPIFRESIARRRRVVGESTREAVKTPAMAAAVDYNVVIVFSVIDQLAKTRRDAVPRSRLPADVAAHFAVGSLHFPRQDLTGPVIGKPFNEEMSVCFRWSPYWGGSRLRIPVQQLASCERVSRKPVITAGLLTRRLVPIQRCESGGIVNAGAFSGHAEAVDQPPHITVGRRLESLRRREQRSAPRAQPGIRSAASVTSLDQHGREEGTGTL